MKIPLFLCCSTVLCALLAGPATAANYLGTAYEGFVYGTAVDAGNPTTDSNMALNNGGTGWNATGDSALANTTAWGSGTGVSTAANANVIFGSLASVAPSSGNSILLNNNGVVGRALGQSVDAGSLYLSFSLLRTTDSIRTINLALFTGTTEKFSFGQFATATAGASSNGNFAGVFLNANPANLIQNPSPITMATGVNHQIILRVDFNANGANERVRVYVDPVSVADETLLTPYLDNSGFDLGAIDIIRPFTGAATTTGVILAAGSGQFDEIRVSSSFAQVTTVPEPGVVGFMGVGLLGLLSCRRRSGQSSR